MSSERILFRMTSSPILTADQENALRCLPQLQRYGFTALQLQNWKGTFDEEHEEALCYLGKSGMAPDVACKIVSGLSSDEAAGISQGLTRAEVLALNKFQISALLLLRKDGLTVEHLRSWEGDWFTEFHKQALVNLIQERHKTPQFAVAEINQLDLTQAQAIAAGFNREDVIDFNYDQVETLILLKDKLTATQLRTWSGKEFYYTHKDALKYLIVDCGKSAIEAISEINGLNGSEAEGVAHGLKQHEAKGLQEYQSRALVKLRKLKPITEFKASDLRKWEGKYFSLSHNEALIDMVNARGFKLEDAVAELNNMDEFEARMIAERRLRRDEVLGFNGWEVDILEELKSKGLKPEHLRSRITPDHVRYEIDKAFLSGHDKALRYLITILKPEDAIKQLNGLDNTQAERLAMGESREGILRGTVSFKR